MSYSEKLDTLEEQLFSLQDSVDSSRKEMMCELKQLEKELANINKFRDEIAIFKELILKKFGTQSKQELERLAKFQTKSP